MLPTQHTVCLIVAWLVMQPVAEAFPYPLNQLPFFVRAVIFLLPLLLSIPGQLIAAIPADVVELVSERDPQLRTLEILSYPTLVFLGLCVWQYAIDYLVLTPLSTVIGTPARVIVTVTVTGWFVLAFVSFAPVVLAIPFVPWSQLHPLFEDAKRYFASGLVPPGPVTFILYFISIAYLANVYFAAK